MVDIQTHGHRYVGKKVRSIVTYGVSSEQSRDLITNDASMDFSMIAPY